MESILGNDGGVGSFTVHWAEVTIDCRDVQRASRFWSELLKVSLDEPGLPRWARTKAVVPGGPVLNFQPVPEAKRQKAALHLDLVTNDLAAAMRWVEDNGGTFTGETHIYDEGTVAVMTDTEGNEFCLVAAATAASNQV